jgi:type IV secretory pathway TraG/TraD family ATPase VirD4
MPTETIVAFVMMGGMAFMVLVAVVRLFLKRKRGRPDPLDHVLFWWTNEDSFTVRNLLNGGVSIIGRAGSGKTSSSGKLLGNAIVRHKKSGGLILCAKPEDAAMWKEIFERAGRKEDLILFAPDMPHRFNFLDYVIKSGGNTREVVRCITTIGETLRSSDTKGGENADFWEREQERTIFNAVVILRLAEGKVSAPDIQKFISGAALNPATIATTEWQAASHNQSLKKAFEARKTPIEEADFQLAIDYWLGEFPNMADKTRSSILTGVMGILHTFNTGMVRELVSGETNCSPDDMLAGKWILVNMSPAEWGDQGAFVCGGWKFLTQKRVLRREAKDGDCINVIWCDEAQQFVTSFCAHYLAQCRSHMGCMVYLTQSLHGYYSTLHGQTGKHQADALLTNFHHKIFHALGDEQTANYAANLVGKSLQTFVGTSTPPTESYWDELMVQTRTTTSTSEHYEAILQPNVFQNGLRTGGKSAGLICDGIVVRSGEAFSNGQNFLWVPFNQK